MTLQEVMKKRNFVVCGDTKNEEKYAYKIKNKLIESGYDVLCVGKELPKIDDVTFDDFILDLCINPSKGIALLREMTSRPTCVVIQPGAESDEIKDFLSKNSIPYLEACLLVGMRLYPRKS